MNHAKRPQPATIRAMAIVCMVIAGGPGKCPCAAETAVVRTGSRAVLPLVSDADRDGLLTEGDAAARAAGGTALVMANRDDDDRDGRPDADDEHVNGPDDVRDLVPLAVVLPAGAQQVQVSAGSAPVRWYRKSAAGWRHLGLHGAEIPLEAGSKDTAGDLELHLESCAWKGLPASWDGRATVVVTAVDAAGGTLASGTVAYDVAAVTLLPATARVTEVFAASGGYDNAAFLDGLGRILEGLDVPLTVHPAAEWREMWMQDTMEIGTAAIPGSHMHVVLGGLRGADRFPPTLLGPDTAVAEVARPRAVGGGDAWADWYGNLEVSPATAAWPRGRVIHGRNARTAVSFHPDVVAFLAAQNVQPPVWIDTSWLLIKHVDEIVAFMPGRHGEWMILVPDPLEGLRLAGNGGVSANVANRRREANARISRALEAMLAGDERDPRAGAVGDPGAGGLLDLLGIEASRVVRLPVAFDVPAAGLLDDGGVTDASSLWSNPVNALFVNGGVICGAAGMPDAVRRICLERFLAAGAARIEFIDDGVYQKNHGNVHCATNARRHDAGARPDKPAK